MFDQLKRVMAVGLIAICGWGGFGCAQRVEREETPGELLTRAWMSYRLSEWENALQFFNEVRHVSQKGDESWVMAQYGLAVTWDRRRPGEKPERATALFEELLKVAPDSQMAPWAMLALVRQQHLVRVGQEPNYEVVNAGYRQIIDRFPEHLAAREAFLYLKSIQIATLDTAELQKAVAELEKFVDTDREEFVGPAWSLLAVSYQLLDEQEKRLAAEQNAFRLTEVDPTDPFAEFAWAYWNLACIAEFEVGDFALARGYYEQLMAEYPNDIRVYGCKQALKRMDALEAQLREEEGL